MDRRRFWTYPPFQGTNPRWPLSLGGDEYNRSTIVIGWRWTGQIVIALEDPEMTVDREAGALFVYIPQEEPINSMLTIKSVHPQVNLELDAEGRLVGIEAFVPVIIKEKREPLFARGH